MRWLLLSDGRIVKNTGKIVSVNNVMCLREKDYEYGYGNRYTKIIKMASTKKELKGEKFNH